LRSVFIHLWETTEAEVASTLRRQYPQQDEPWVHFDAEQAVLYIEFYREGPKELEDWVELFMPRLPPRVSVIVDISGRCDGWKQTRDFVVWLLGEFDGVASDDAWLRMWSKDEVQLDQVIDGRRFGAWRNPDDDAPFD
jgi:hypothetical protein